MYSNKIESVSLRKCPYDHWVTNKAYLSAITVTNIYQSSIYKMEAKIRWHRYGTKLRHCQPMYRPTSNLVRRRRLGQLVESIGLVWGLAATRRSVYIHQMNRVNSRNDFSHDDSAITLSWLLLLSLLLSVLFLWRYEPVRRTGKYDDWLTIFCSHNKVQRSEIPIVLSNLLYHYFFHWNFNRLLIIE